MANPNSDIVRGGGVSRTEFREFKAEMSEFKAEVNQKHDVILELLQAHMTGTAKRLDALEGPAGAC